MSDQVPVRKAAIYRAIDVLIERSDAESRMAKACALDFVLGQGKEPGLSRDAAIQWHHSSVAFRDSVAIIKAALDEAVRSGEPLV